MANIMQNRVDAILDPKSMQSIFDNISAVIGSIPNIANLTLNDDERTSLSSLDVNNKVFVEDVIEALKQNGEDIMPASINVRQIENDLTLFTQMDKIHGHLSDALQRIEDLRRIAASEAYSASTVVYGIYGLSAQSGIPGAQASYNKLKERYKNQGGGAPKKED